MALSDNLLHYYKCDEASGVLLDAHGSVDGTDNNTVGTGTGKINSARSFVAANSEYFSFGTAISLPGEMSVSMWVNAAAIGSHLALIWDNDTGGQFGVRIAADGNIHWFQGTGSGVLHSSALSASTYYHLVFIRSGSAGSWSVSAYIDGSIGTSSPQSFAQNPPASPTDVRIGYSAAFGFPFDGLMDEIGIWDRALSGAEVTELYNAGSGRDYSYITGGGGGDPEGSLIGGKLIRGGLLLHGVLGR